MSLKLLLFCQLSYILKRFNPFLSACVRLVDSQARSFKLVHSISDTLPLDSDTFYVLVYGESRLHPIQSWNKTMEFLVSPLRFLTRFFFNLVKNKVTINHKQKNAHSSSLFHSSGLLYNTEIFHKIKW